MLLYIYLIYTDWRVIMKSFIMPPKKRILYFDYLEILAIFLVVSIHRPWFDCSYSSSFLSIICSICVPLFFMVNGALLFHKSFNLPKHMHKILSLFIAVEGWRLLYLIVSLITKQVSFDNFSKSELWYYFCGSQTLNHVPTAHMWFTYTLLFLYILFPLLKVCWDYNKPVLYFFTTMCGIFFQFSEEINVLLFQITSALHINSTLTIDGFRSTLSPLNSNGHFLVYFVLGAILHDIFFVHPITLANSKKFRPICILCIALGLLWDSIAKYLQCGTLLWTGESFKNGYLKLGTVFMCIGIFALFSTYNFHKFSPKLNACVSFVSSRTLDIYYIHMFFAAVALDYIYPQLHVTNIIINSLRTLVIILISLGIGHVFRKLPIFKHLLNV